MGGIPVSPEVEKRFQDTWLEFRGKGEEPAAKEVLDAVTRRLQIEGKGNVPLPRLRKVQLILSKFRARYSVRPEEEKIKDNFWSLAACRDYPFMFPPDSLLILMKMQEYHRQFEDAITGKRSLGFSIRKAMWMVRLQPLVKEYFKSGNFEEETEILSNIAEAYSIAEIRSITLGKFFDTLELDKALYTKDFSKILIFMSKSELKLSDGGK